MTPAAGRPREMFAAYAGNNDINDLMEKHQMNINMLKKTLDDPALDREERMGSRKKIYLLESNMKILYRMDICRSSAFNRQSFGGTDHGEEGIY